VKVAGGRTDEPNGRGSGGVGRERCAGAVEAGDGFVGEIVPDLDGGGGGVVVLDGVGVGAGEIKRVVVDLSGRR